MPPRTRIEIGFVNNMPDAALAATERQFSRLIEQASGDLDINISLYTLESLPRQPGTLLAIGQTYRPARELRAHSPDALIVTGAEPHAPDLRDEPYWGELAGLAEWAQSHTISCLFSCLAAHAEVLRRDKIVRRRQPIKLHGVFEAEVVASHELVEGLGARASIPHSRYNGLDEGELAAKGYVTLTRSREGGVDMFVLEEENLSVFLQGHPEYDADTLAREYRRDVQRFMSGELSAPPPAAPRLLSAGGRGAGCRLGRTILQRRAFRVSPRGTSPRRGGLACRKRAALSQLARGRRAS